MQDQVGIDTPDSGILLDYMAVPPGEPLRAAELSSPRIEVEIVFRLGTDLCGTDVAELAARGAVAEACLALEVIDSRFHRDDITLADSVVDNAAGARFVLGEAVPMPSWDLRAERLTVRTGITPVAAGAGRDVLGDPVRSVVGLAPDPDIARPQLVSYVVVVPQYLDIRPKILGHRDVHSGHSDPRSSVGYGEGVGPAEPGGRVCTAGELDGSAVAGEGRRWASAAG